MRKVYLKARCGGHSTTAHTEVQPNANTPLEHANVATAHVEQLGGKIKDFDTTPRYRLLSIRGRTACIRICWLPTRHSTFLRISVASETIE